MRYRARESSPRPHGEGIWQAVGGKRPCDGCGQTLTVEQVCALNTMRGLAFCCSCLPAWADSLNQEPLDAA